MDKRYEVFCPSDRQFYETPDRLSSTRRPSPAGASVHLLEAAQRPVPEGWRRYLFGDWLHISPIGTARPTQGWKIHVTACPDNAEKTAAGVWDHCVPRAAPSTLVPGQQPLHPRNSKYAGRGSSGKFATLYPADESELRLILEEPGEELAGEPDRTCRRWGRTDRTRCGACAGGARVRPSPRPGRSLWRRLDCGPRSYA